MNTAPTPRLASKEPTNDHPDKLGIAVAPAAEVEGAGGQGLAVLQVDPQGKAAEAGLSAGDVMVKAGTQQLANIADLNEAIDAASANGKRMMLVLVRRGDTQRYVAVPVA